MGFIITTLIENGSIDPALAAEHGLSLLIEGEDCRVLYDTGASPQFLDNAGIMGISLESLDALVFSHGHFDHTGGAAELLHRGVRPDAVYLGSSFFEKRYALRPEGMEEIGSRVDEETFAACGITPVVVGGDPVRIAEGLWAVSGFLSTEPTEGPNPRLLRSRGGQRKPDLFEDEVVIVLETEKELVLISGCAHVGILSMCVRTSRLFGRPVTSFLGGTHLKDADENRIQYTCSCLKERGMVRLGACHCSGAQASEYFQSNFPGFFENHGGSAVMIE